MSTWENITVLINVCIQFASNYLYSIISFNLCREHLNYKNNAALVNQYICVNDIICTMIYLLSYFNYVSQKMNKLNDFSHMRSHQHYVHIENTYPDSNNIHFICCIHARHFRI